jgi:hypothetical protein
VLVEHLAQAMADIRGDGRVTDQDTVDAVITVARDESQNFSNKFEKSARLNFLAQSLLLKFMLVPQGPHKEQVLEIGAELEALLAMEGLDIDAETSYAVDMNSGKGVIVSMVQDPDELKHIPERVAAAIGVPLSYGVSWQNWPAPTWTLKFDLPSSP